MTDSPFSHHGQITLELTESALQYLSAIELRAEDEDEDHENGLTGEEKTSCDEKGSNFLQKYETSFQEEKEVTCPCIEVSSSTFHQVQVNLLSDQFSTH